MKIAELFVAIGVQGATQVKNTLGDTRSGLQQTASSALWAKAAIVGVLYGLERLVSASNRTGAELLQFSNYTGMSAERLQRYAYAGRQFGATAEEIKGSLMGVQKAMALLETTGQGPKGMWVVAREVGLDKSRLRDTSYLFEQLQKFAQQSKLPVGIANEALESFGLSQGTIAAMRQNAFNPKTMAQANIYSDKEAGALNRMNAAWGNLSDNIAKAFGHMNVKHGGQMIRDISMITKEALRLADALLALSKNAKFFEAIAKSFEGWGIIIKDLTDRVDAFNKKGFVGGATENAKALGRGLVDSANILDYLTGAPDRRVQKMLEDADRSAAFKAQWQGGHLPPSQAPAGGATVNQQNNFYGVKDARESVGDLKRATSDSVRQSQAQRRKH